MARVTTHADLSLDDPVIVEGLPGVGLVGKIAADHLVDELGMTYYASIDDCDGIPEVATYAEGDHTVRPPVRVYADEARDLLALQSDVPISPARAEKFADCLTAWLDGVDATPVYLSGLPVDEKSTPPEMYGVATGDGATHLGDASVGTPPEEGLISGPTGALLAAAREQTLDAVGLVVQSDKQVPDPVAARVLIKEGVQPIADVDVGLQDLVDRAGEIRSAKERLAEQMNQATDEESTQAKPLRMYQ
jgi:uncharacterized protein